MEEFLDLIDSDREIILNYQFTSSQSAYHSENSLGVLETTVDELTGPLPSISEIINTTSKLN